MKIFQPISYLKIILLIISRAPFAFAAELPQALERPSLAQFEAMSQKKNFLKFNYTNLSVSKEAGLSTLVMRPEADALPGQSYFLANLGPIPEAGPTCEELGVKFDTVFLKDLREGFGFYEAVVGCTYNPDTQFATSFYFRLIAEAKPEAPKNWMRKYVKTHDRIVVHDKVFKFEQAIGTFIETSLKAGLVDALKPGWFNEALRQESRRFSPYFFRVSDAEQKLMEAMSQDTEQLRGALSAYVDARFARKFIEVLGPQTNKFDFVFFPRLLLSNGELVPAFMGRSFPRDCRQSSTSMCP